MEIRTTMNHDKTQDILKSPSECKKTNKKRLLISVYLPELIGGKGSSPKWVLALTYSKYREQMPHKTSNGLLYMVYIWYIILFLIIKV